MIPLALRLSLSYQKKKWLNVLPFGMHIAYVPFLLIGHGRSGSTWLHTLLSSHPQVWSWGEELRPYRQNGSYQPLQEAFSKPYSRNIQAVGAKFFYEDAQAEAGESFLANWLLQQRPLIHLYRENLLRTVISEQRAWATREWSSKKRSASKLEPLTFALDKGLQRMEILEMQQVSMQQRLQHANCFTLTYEMLEADPLAHLAEVQAYLRLPVRPLYSLLQQQNGAPIRRLIKNYSELSRILEEKGWQKFLD